MKGLKIAIIGAGTAGLALAAMLVRQDIHVTLFEKVDTLDPVGAGLLLQPAGLAVFQQLGILAKATALGAKVTGLHGQLSNGHLIVNSHYQQADSDFFGLGIHRSTLCHVLADALHDYDNMTWCLSSDIQQLLPSQQEIRVVGLQQQHAFSASFDMAIVANGARSQLRPSAWVKLDQAYPWGAAWSILPECTGLDPEILHQFYQGSQTMLGILPTGRLPNSTTTGALSSLFWSLPSTALPSFITSPKANWLQHIHARWPEVAAWLQPHLENSQQPMQWLTAHYRDVVMRQYGQHRIGVIGDAAHAMSPQLGQGANMALLDAWALSQAIVGARKQQQLDFAKLWQHYHQLRQPSIQMYQSLSRLLTPLYQSNIVGAGALRNIAFSAMNQIPYLRKQMAITISGLKTGLLQHLDYDDIANS